MNVTVENLGPCKKLMRVEVEVEKLDKAFEEVTKEFQKEAALPGFRPGKAPKDMVVRKYSADIEAEVKRITKGEGVAVVYDSVGRDTFDKSLACLAPLGYMVLFGQSSGFVPPLDVRRLADRSTRTQADALLGGTVVLRIRGVVGIGHRLLHLRDRPLHRRAPHPRLAAGPWRGARVRAQAARTMMPDWMLLDVRIMYAHFLANGRQLLTGEINAAVDGFTSGRGNPRGRINYTGTNADPMTRFLLDQYLNAVSPTNFPAT